jgi:hypothetical protein
MGQVPYGSARIGNIYHDKANVGHLGIRRM